MVKNMEKGCRYGLICRNMMGIGLKIINMAQVYGHSQMDNQKEVNLIKATEQGGQMKIKTVLCQAGPYFKVNSL